jgi:formylglycine-generating enzyme required for sulfatase activity
VNPSQYGPLRYSGSWNREGKSWTALHPVEQVSWNDCVHVLDRLGLALPSEAQWEYAARAGTSTVWWTGSDRTSLAGAANLADTYGKTHGNELWSAWEAGLDDGNTVPAEIGSYRANGFGLHDVAGNVLEWCLDVSEGTYYRSSPRKDPVDRAARSPHRTLRGGSFDTTASVARSALRGSAPPDEHSSQTGLRPARTLDP